MTNDDCGSGAGCLYKEARIDTLTERIRVLREALQIALPMAEDEWSSEANSQAGIVSRGMHAVQAMRAALEATK